MEGWEENEIERGGRRGKRICKKENKRKRKINK